MFRIDGPDAAPTIPTPMQPGKVPGYFTDGDATTGTEATIVDADFLNSIQEELAYVIESSGLTLSKSDRTQLAQALQRLGRQRLIQDLELFVSNAGSDNNSGLTPNTAFASLSHAYAYVRDRLDLNGHQVTVWIIDGNYAPLWATFPVVGPPVKFIGNPQTPGNVKITNPNGPAVTGAFNANLWLESFHVGAASGTTDYLQSGSGIVASGAANITINNIECGACTTACLEALSASSISFPGAGASFTVVGGAQTCVSAGYGGILTLVDGTVNLIGTPHFSGGFAGAFGAGVVQAWGATFAGPATGPRYSLGTNGCAITSTGNPNFFPGDQPGVLVDPSGVYT
jgi:hypothetical protein